MLDKPAGDNLRHDVIRVARPFMAIDAQRTQARRRGPRVWQVLERPLARSRTMDRLSGDVQLDNPNTVGRFEVVADEASEIVARRATRDDAAGIYSMLRPCADYISLRMDGE